jgi:acetyl esterase/lipase
MYRLRGLIVAVVALGAAGCVQYVAPEGRTPLRYRDAVFSAAVKTMTGITYGHAATGGAVVALKLDAYEPAGDRARARPAIVWVHSGAFAAGSRTMTDMVSEAKYFAKLGYFNVSIDYRTTSATGCTVPVGACVGAMRDAQHDAQAAVRWLRATANANRVDVNRIAIAGTSAGGITAKNVAYNAGDPGASGNAGWSSRVRAAVSVSGAQLLGKIDRGEPPSLDFHGTRDPIVPYAWAVSDVNEGKAARVAVFLTADAGQGHELTDSPSRFDEMKAQTRNFLYASMDLEHAAR